jgi:hypothetical protein
LREINGKKRFGGNIGQADKNEKEEEEEEKQSERDRRHAKPFMMSGILTPSMEATCLPA